MVNTFLKKLDNASTQFLRLSVLQNTFLRDDAFGIIKNSFEELTKRDYFKYIDQQLFLFLADRPGWANDEILYLLGSNHSLFHLLTPTQIIDLIRYNPEVFDHLLVRFHELDLSKHGLVKNLLYACLDNEERLLKFIGKVFESKNENAISTLIFTLASHGLLEDYEILKQVLYDSHVHSIPSIMSRHVDLDGNLRYFLVSNFEELLEYEEINKMNFINFLQHDIPDDLKRKYDYLINILNAGGDRGKILKRLNILLENRAEDFIKDYVSDRSVSYLKAGSTAQAFRIGDDKVLKFATMKHIPATIYEHFLLAPTERKVIRDIHNKPILYVEKQDFLPKVYKGVSINSDDFNNFFDEIKRQNLIVRDPKCVKRQTDNFGFLRDYTDATLVGVNSHDELPDWFKRRPLVIFDIDMIEQKRRALKKDNY